MDQYTRETMSKRVNRKWSQKKYGPERDWSLSTKRFQNIFASFHVEVDY